MKVDLGNALARRTDTQSQADYGAFAAARPHPRAPSLAWPSRRDAERRRDALNNNQPQDDNSNCW